MCGENEFKVWHDPDTASYWALQYLWSYPTKEEAHQHIKKTLKEKVLYKERRFSYI